METAEQYGLKASVDAPSTVHKDDTVHLTVHVTWTSAPQAWLLLPQNSPEGSKLTQVNVSTDQVRAVHNGTETPEIQVKYLLIAKDTGTAAVPAMQFQLPLASGGSIQLSSEPVNIQVLAPVAWGLWLAILGAVVLAGVAAFFVLRQKKQAKAKQGIVDVQKKQLKDKFETLASRVQAAEPRTWIRELEDLCNEVKVQGATLAPEQAQQWAKLQDAFAQARYGAGPRDTWENKEWLRIARSVLNIHDSEDEEKHG